jgi:Uracil-DNA glycosylase
MSVDEQLMKQYRRFADRVAIEAVCETPESTATMMVEIDGPFLIKPHQEYERSKPKVVIVGQENNGWIGTYKDFLEKRTIEEALRLYEDFDLERSYNTTFFQCFATIRDSLFGLDPQKRRAILWLNLFKFNQGLNPQMIYSAYRDKVLNLQGDVFQQEIAVLRPDVILFLTGPYYDSVIQQFYPSVRFEPIDGHPVNQVARVVHEGLPANSFRTYHPSYLNRFRDRTAHCLPTILKTVSDAVGPR